jgi:nickel/cobalt transporter (NiCoT) family protein
VEGGVPGSLAATEPMAGPLSRREKGEVAVVYLGILIATVGAFGATFLVARTYGIFLGLGILAYTLGLRHGVDADHICAIDNTTRKLLQQGKRPHTVGTWFSLGHSTVVLGLLVGLVVAARWVVTNLPGFEAEGGMIGGTVSGGFLYLIAAINLLILFEIYAIFRKLRAGSLDEQALEEQLNQRGFMSRYFNFLFRLVNEPWQIYPIGVLFGLGFDTATEVALIAITVTVGTATAGFPLWTVLVLPVLFTCGMVLVDTSDGVGMRYAYGWAFLKPIRKVYYNLTMTVISVLVAFLIGTIELLGVAAAAFHLTGGPFGLWGAVGWLNGGVGTANFDIWGYVGIAIVVLFLGCWLVAIAIYRWRRYEEVGFGPAPPPAPLDPI